MKKTVVWAGEEYDIDLVYGEKPLGLIFSGHLLANHIYYSCWNGVNSQMWECDLCLDTEEIFNENDPQERVGSLIGEGDSLQHALDGLYAKVVNARDYLDSVASGKVAK